jgi:hypothetical protein
MTKHKKNIERFIMRYAVNYYFFNQSQACTPVTLESIEREREIDKETNFNYFIDSFEIDWKIAITIIL